MKIKNIKKILLILFILIIASYTKSYCTTTSTTGIQINNGTPWVNISVSDAYQKCIDLNSTQSTLGTTDARAHLTTVPDWSAMAMLSVSQYGATTTNKPESTTNNASGVYNVGIKNVYTSGILNTTTKETNNYVNGLFNEDGTTKEYVQKHNYDNIWLKRGTGTRSWYTAEPDWYGTIGRPAIITNGLFSMVWINDCYGTDGNPNANYTFRPVLWN